MLAEKMGWEALGLCIVCVHAATGGLGGPAADGLGSPWPHVGMLQQEGWEALQLRVGKPWPS